MIEPAKSKARSVSSLAPEKSTHMLSPVDWVVFAYLVYIPLLTLILGRPLESYTSVFLNNALTAAVVLAIVRFFPLGRSRVSDIIRLVYPALLFGYFYTQTGSLMRLVYPEFLDPRFVTWEANLLGTNPTLWLDRNFLATPAATWVTEILSMAYSTYYAMFPALLISLLILRRNKLIQEILTASLITFAVSFNLFWLFPLEGPRWHFADVYQHAVTGVVFRPVVEFIIANGAVHGGAMPSTHTGIALVVLIYMFREYRAWFWIGLPLVIGIGAGAVYGRFHYVSDIFVGAAISAVCVWFTMRYYPRWTARAN